MDSNQVRRFADADAAPLTSMLHDAYAELGAMGLNFTAVDQSPEVTLARCRSGHCWVVEDPSTHALVATVTASLPPSPVMRERSRVADDDRLAWINQLAVAPSHRGTGLASVLWATVRTWATTHGATAVGLDTAAPASHLIRMYERWGFTSREVLHWPGKTYDSVVMVADLPPHV